MKISMLYDRLTIHNEGTILTRRMNGADLPVKRENASHGGFDNNVEIVSDLWIDKNAPAMNTCILKFSYLNNKSLNYLEKRPMATKKHCSETKRFSDEDQIRVAGMREEIIARLTEISLIMARPLDIAPPSNIREFTINDGPARESLGISAIKTSGPSAAGGTATITSWGCTCHANKVCCSAPCPPCT